MVEIVCDVRLSAVGVKITVFWDMTPCTLLKSCRRSEAPSAPYYHSVYAKAHGATFLNALILNISNRLFFFIFFLIIFNTGPTVFRFATQECEDCMQHTEL